MIKGEREMDHTLYSGRSRKMWSSLQDAKSVIQLLQQDVLNVEVHIFLFFFFKVYFLDTQLQYCSNNKNTYSYVLHSSTV